jgi:large subunit ribosomal protein L2
VLNLDKHFTLRLKSKSGRNDTGRIIIRTKTSILKKYSTTKINYHLRYRKLGAIVSFKFIPFRNQLLSLIYFSNGAITYYLAADSHALFTFFFFNKHKKLKKIKIKNLSLMLCQIKKLSFVSCLELLPGQGAKYTRSAGTKSRIIKFDKDTHSVLLQLPSKIKKIFSYYSFALLNGLALSENKRFTHTKAGY